jgi:hypothetical protein
MNKQEENIVQKLKEVSTYYMEVKALILLAESLSQKFPISPMNELQNCLDHIMRAVRNNDAINYEILEAERHLSRAAKDAYEISLVMLMGDIQERLKKFDDSFLVKEFPDYYSDVRPKLVKIRDETVKMRIYEVPSGKSLEIVEGYKKSLDELSNLRGRVEEAYSRLNLTYISRDVLSQMKRWMIFFCVIIFPSLFVIILFLLKKC